MELPSWLGALSALGSSVTWAIASSSYAKLAAHHPATSINFSRATIALPIFLVIALITAPEAVSGGVPAGTLGWVALSVIASYAVGDVCFFLSALSIGVPSALAIASTFPLLSALAGVALRGEALSAHRAVGVLLTVGGTILVILATGRGNPGAPLETPHLARPKHAPAKRWGLGLAFATSFFWSLNAVAVAEAGRTLPALWVNVLRMSFSMAFCPLVGVLIAGLTRSAPPRRPWVSAKDIKKSLGIFIMEGFGGSLMFTYGLAHAPLSVAPALCALAPVIAVPIAWAQGQGRFLSVRTLGVLLVVAGLVLL